MSSKVETSVNLLRFATGFLDFARNDMMKINGKF
jgi:hypothetical protein